ncbi:hypothetical protein [Modicisalibacter radicis]|uniref:hypothetical protein n=1 Tax=Halomonas sp. EAR18 TaxID=2518972 RepID=UPI00109D35FD|nr:hypothetical protein [Halomonas sp. EAR18]
MAQQEFTPTTARLQQDSLILACSHEHQSLNRYRLLSLRFLPYSVALSRLFEAFASESEQRIQALMQMAKYCQAVGVLPAISPAIQVTSDHDRRHFFVVDDTMAGLVLVDILFCEHQSVFFYQQLSNANCLPELNALLVTFAEQKRAECRVLQESQDHLLLDGCMPERQRVA